MKENCKILEDDVEYTNLNKIRRRYSIIEVDGTKVTRATGERTLSERYRPRKIFDLVLPEEHINYLTERVKLKNLNNLLVYSQKGGLGKTSMSQVLTHEMGSEFITLRANIERGIQAVKDSLVPYCKTKAMNGKGKIACIEEIGDATTAQVDSFKSLSEDYSSNITFIITTNSLANISQPLKTRFKIIDLNSFTAEEKKYMTVRLIKRIKAILDIEDISYTPEDIKYLFNKYQFSVREIMMAIDSSIVNGKLDLKTTEDNNKTTLYEILEMINNKDFKSIASSADAVNHLQFLEELQASYLDILGSLEMIPGLIMIMNELQNSLLRNPAFPGITFVKCCNDMIRENINFRI